MAGNVDLVLSKVLVERGIVSRDVLDPLVMKAAAASGGLATLLVQRGLVPEDAILTILAEQFKIARLDLARCEIQKTAIDKVPLKIAEYYHFLPIKLEQRRLTVAVSLPLDIRTQDEIRAHTGCEIEMVLARAQDIADAVKKWYGLGAGTIEKILHSATTEETGKAPPQQQPEEKVEEIGDAGAAVGDASVIQLVNQILLDAVQKRATDIHFEPYRGKMKIRYRIDGVLQNTNVPPEIKQFIMSIVSRIKIMSNLNIIEKRLPQDGRAIIKVSGDTLDLRVSSIPTPSGESIVIRLLPMNRLISLEKLGLDKIESDIFTKLIEKPHGIILITGPTGSGKSTTLYACLSMINTDERKIITIEDPVEYEMEGVTQIQVQSSIGLTFAAGLRSVLRHDPDVIMVGEIRDLETAEIASRVALTGHLVFSTLHTNDAASGVTRLIDIGVEPYLVASSVEAFLAQRLVRMICPHCKEEDPAQPETVKALIAKELGLPRAQDVTIYKGKGCDKCNFTGFWGRIAIFEILLIDETIREMIMKQVPASDIQKMAISKGMRPLRKCGWQKVIAGLTTPEEILEVAPEEVGMAEEPVAVSADMNKQERKTITKEMSVEKPVVLDSNEHAGVERRAYRRVEFRANIRYRIVKPPEKFLKADLDPEHFSATKNLSAGGLVFAARERLATGIFLELKMELPESKTLIECYARVVRVASVEDEHIYDIAVCFLDLSGADRKKIDDFIKAELGIKVG